MINRHRLRDLVDQLYDIGELLVRVESFSEGYFVLDKSGDVPQRLRTRGEPGDDDRRIADAIFLLCGLDHTVDRGPVKWEIVANVYEDVLCLFEVTYEIAEWAKDGVADTIFYLEKDGDERLSALKDE